MFSESTLRREVKALHEMQSEAMRESHASSTTEREDWIYGALCGLLWAINDPENQTMKPSRAFSRELMRT